MLFSYVHQRWKIADFGTTSEGTSRKLSQTTAARGTAVYRAPELLAEDGGYHSKSDIWAFGCIAYEFCTKRKAFAGDFEVREYRHSAEHSPKMIFDGSGSSLGGEAAKLAWEASQKCVDDSLRYTWDKRPSASDLLNVLKDLDMDSL